MIRALGLRETGLLLRSPLPNEARTRGTINGVRLPSSLLTHTLAGRWRTWVLEERGRLQSLLSVRPRGGPRAWEVVYLYSPEKEGALALLQEASLRLGQRGALRLFVRLPQESPLLPAVRLASFSPFTEEREFAAQHPRAPEALPLRPRAGGDDHRLFLFYQQIVPGSVAQAQGVGVEEWRESQERWPREWVREREGQVCGWLRLEERGPRGFLSLLAPPQDLDGALGYGLARLRGRAWVHCLALAFQGELEGSLLELGFQKVGENTLLVKELVARVPQPSLAPLHA